MSTKQISGPYKYRANIYIPENIPNKKKKNKKRKRTRLQSLQARIDGYRLK